MDFAPASTRKLSALLLVFAATYFGVHLWIVLTALINDTDRTVFLDMAGESITYWSVFCVLGVVLGAFALRYERLSIWMQRAGLISAGCAGLVAGYLAEWWTSLYFLLPAIFLPLAHRRAAHA